MILRSTLILALVAALAGCSSKPPAEVSKNELATIRKAHDAATIGTPKQQVLDSYKSGNVVKLGSSAFEGSTVEEWKAEAFHDESKRKDLFITFLYFVDDKFVDSSDTRIDFRANEALLTRWKQSMTRV